MGRSETLVTDREVISSQVKSTVKISSKNRIVVEDGRGYEKDGIWTRRG